MTDKTIGKLKKSDALRILYSKKTAITFSTAEMLKRR